MKDFQENPNYDASKGLFNVLTNEQVEWIFDTMPERQERFKATLDKMRKDIESDITEDLISDTALESYEKYSIGEEID